MIGAVPPSAHATGASSTAPRRGDAGSRSPPPHRSGQRATSSLPGSSRSPQRGQPRRVPAMHTLDVPEHGADSEDKVGRRRAAVAMTKTHAGAMAKLQAVGER